MEKRNHSSGRNENSKSRPAFVHCIVSQDSYFHINSCELDWAVVLGPGHTFKSSENLSKHPSPRGLTIRAPDLQSFLSFFRAQIWIMFKTFSRDAKVQPELRTTEPEQLSSILSLSQNCLEGLLKHRLLNWHFWQKVWNIAPNYIVTMPRRCWCFWPRDRILRTTQLKEHIALLCLFHFFLPCDKEWLIPLLSLGEETVCSAEQPSPFFWCASVQSLPTHSGCPPDRFRLVSGSKIQLRGSIRPHR